MSIRKTVIFALCGLSMMSVSALSAEHEPANSHAPSHADAYPHPQLSGKPSWASNVVVGIIGSFILAAGVGVVYKIAVTPEREPEPVHEDHSHGHH